MLKMSPVDVTTPTPILFALPSNPMATRGRDDAGEVIEDARATSPSLDRRDASPKRRRACACEVTSIIDARRDHDDARARCRDETNREDAREGSVVAWGAFVVDDEREGAREDGDDDDVSPSDDVFNGRVVVARARGCARMDARSFAGVGVVARG